MEVECFMLLIAIELCAVNISIQLYGIRKILEDIRDSKEVDDNDT